MKQSRGPGVPISIVVFAFFSEVSMVQTAQPPLSPIFSFVSSNGLHGFAAGFDVARRNSMSNAIAFYAICTNRWLPGLAPIFAIEKTNWMELRRLPARGQENFTEPLFFALPPEDEPAVSTISGRWECHATREDKSKSYFAWELTLEGKKVSGRFDQDTDYRFAFITGGILRSNQLELRIEHVSNAYLLSGTWRNGTFHGVWERTDKSEKGEWYAERPKGSALLLIVSNRQSVALFEWRRQGDESRRYSLEGNVMPNGWKRSARPLCRVWRKP